MRNSWAIKNHIEASWEQYKLSGDTRRVVLVTAVFGKSNHTQGKSNRKNTKARVSLCSRKPWTLKEHLLLYEINCIFYGTMNTGNNERTDNSSLFTRGLDTCFKNDVRGINVIGRSAEELLSISCPAERISFPLAYPVFNFLCSSYWTSLSSTTLTNLTPFSSCPTMFLTSSEWFFILAHFWNLMSDFRARGGGK